MQTLTIRAFLAAVVLSGTVAASAAAPANPDKAYPLTPSAKRPQLVLVSFRNLSGQHRDIAIGGQRFPVSPSSELTLRIAVGSTVYERSDMNTRIDGKPLLTVGTDINRHTILLP